MLMELVQGPDLSLVRLETAGFRACFGQLADALHAVAAARIVHRDVKPANILLRPVDHTPVLVDFGLAVDLADSSQGPTPVSGTPFFMAPEAFLQKVPEPSWDAYSLGLTAAVLLLGQPDDFATLSALRHAKLSGEFDQLLQDGLGRIADDDLRRWIALLLQTDPEKRLEGLETARQWREAA
jgi:serine/threonine-protein kinase